MKEQLDQLLGEHVSLRIDSIHKTKRLVVYVKGILTNLKNSCLPLYRIHINSIEGVNFNEEMVRGVAVREKFIDINVE